MYLISLAAECIWLVRSLKRLSAGGDADIKQ